MAEEEQVAPAEDMDTGEDTEISTGVADDFPQVEEGGFDETFMPPDPVTEKGDTEEE